MITIIRRYPRQRPAALVLGLAATLLLALITWVILMLWARGGPQRVHEIVIALPAPKPAASAGPRA